MTTLQAGGAVARFAGEEAIMLIPGMSGRMVHEFEEYRPYTSLEQFRREIGKYVDEEEVARLEQYGIAEYFRYQQVSGMHGFLKPDVRLFLHACQHLAVEPPELETRVAILMKKADQVGVDLPHDAAFFIAQRIRSNVRELEGALKRVVANAQFTGRPIDVDLVREALKDLLALQDKQVGIDNIQRVVGKDCRHLIRGDLVGSLYQFSPPFKIDDSALFIGEGIDLGVALGLAVRTGGQDKRKRFPLAGRPLLCP